MSATDSKVANPNLEFVALGSLYWWRNAITWISLACYLLVTSSEGPIRHYFGGLVQVKDAFLITMVMMAILDRKVNRCLLGLALVCSVWVSVGFIFNRAGSSTSILLGLKQTLPWFAGVSLSSFTQNITIVSDRLGRILVCCFLYGICALVSTSCIFDFYYGVPWAGGSQVIMGETVETSREWHADSVRRIAGVTRASYDAASIVAVTALLGNARMPIALLRGVVNLIAAAIILLTTSKGILLSFVLVTATDFVILDQVKPKQIQIASRKLLMFVSLVLVIALPLFSLVGRDLGVNEIRITEGFSGESFAERLEDVWPPLLNEVFHESPLIGFGIGGAGSPLSIVAPELFLPTDNLFVFLYSVGGVVGLSLLAAIAIGAWRVQRVQTQLAQSLTVVLIFTLNYGITSSVLEHGWLSLFLMFAVSLGLSGQQKNG